MGRELGYHGLNDFIEIKQIFTDGTGLTMKPPYGQVLKDEAVGDGCLLGDLHRVAQGHQRLRSTWGT
jgi:hypothetical protein